MRWPTTSVKSFTNPRLRPTMLGASSVVTDTIFDMSIFLSLHIFTTISHIFIPVVFEDKVFKPSNSLCISLPAKYLTKTDGRADDVTSVISSRQIQKKSQTAKSFSI